MNNDLNHNSISKNNRKFKTKELYFLHHPILNNITVNVRYIFKTFAYIALTLYHRRDS
jgi:hypothetical protein